MLATQIAIFLALLVAALAEENAEEEYSVGDIVEMMEPMADDCKPKPTKEDFVELLMNKEDAKQSTKCLRYCLMKQMEVMPEGGTELNVEKATGMMSMMYPEREEETEKIVKKCAVENAAIKEGCDAAHTHGMCIMKGLKEAGYSIPKLKE